MTSSFSSRWASRLSSALGPFYGKPMRLCIMAAKSAAAAHVVMTYGFHAGAASGASMLPTFDITGDWILIDKRFRFGRNIVVGDIVNYRIPIFRHSEGVKRVIGMPGDYVLMHSPDSDSHRMIQVPQGHCWLVGDNLEASRDSRLFGPVPLALIHGKVIARLLPWSNRQIFENGLVEPETVPHSGRQR